MGRHSRHPTRPGRTAHWVSRGLSAAPLGASATRIDHANFGLKDSCSPSLGPPRSSKLMSRASPDTRPPAWLRCQLGCHPAMDARGVARGGRRGGTRTRMGLSPAGFRPAAAASFATRRWIRTDVNNAFHAVRLTPQLTGPSIARLTHGPELCSLPPRPSHSSAPHSRPVRKAATGPVASGGHLDRVPLRRLERRGEQTTAIERSSAGMPRRTRT